MSPHLASFLTKGFPVRKVLEYDDCAVSIGAQISEFNHTKWTDQSHRIQYKRSLSFSSWPLRAMLHIYIYGYGVNANQKSVLVHVTLNIAKIKSD